MGVRLFLALVLFMVVSSCGSNGREEILVFTAASLTDVMEKLGDQFTEREGIKVNISAGGSTALAQQIISGAPVDAFIPAGPQPMDRLEKRGLLLPYTRVDLLTNKLVLVGPPDVSDKMGIASVEDLASADASVAIADPDLAPAGRYAREALRNLALWPQLEPRLVFGLDVRGTLNYVKTGNVDVGIVYRTDTRIVEGLEILATLPEGSYSPIVYPAGVIAHSDHVDAASKFVVFLRGDVATETFQEYGFIRHTEG